VIKRTAASFKILIEVLVLDLVMRTDRNAMEQKKILIRKAKLDNMIAAYAEIWAEVLLDKNLVLHLIQIEDDLRYINRLINLNNAVHPHVPAYFAIAKQLIRLQEIIVQKLQRNNE
jgi:hypothetical protein